MIKCFCIRIPVPILTQYLPSIYKRTVEKVTKSTKNIYTRLISGLKFFKSQRKYKIIYFFLNFRLYLISIYPLPLYVAASKEDKPMNISLFCVVVPM